MTYLLNLLFISSLLLACRETRPERIGVSKKEVFGSVVPAENADSTESVLSEFVAGGGMGTLNSEEMGSMKDGELKAPASLQYSKTISRDAYSFTHGVLPLDLQQVDNGMKLGFQRFIYADDLSAVRDDVKTALNKLCKDMGVSSAADEFKAFKEMDRSHGMFLHWRSHYNAGLKNILGGLLAQSNRIYCVMKIDIQGEKSNEAVYAMLDPLPLSSGFIGAADLKKASEEGIMLVDVKTQAMPFDAKHLMPVEGAGSVLAGIPAVNGKELGFSTRDIPDEQPCYYAEKSSALTVGDPAAMQYFAHDLKSERELKFVSAESSAIGGRVLDACASVKIEQMGSGSYNLSYSCETYQAVKNQGLEAACAWSMKFENVLDPENSIAVSMVMDKTEFKTVDINKYTEVIQVLPKAEENPVRNAKTNFVNFSPERLASVEQAFDFWIAVDPTSFKAEYQDYVPRITYLSDKPDLCGTSGGFVDEIGKATINLCPHGALLEDDLAQNKSNPHLPIYRAILLAHETHHTRGWFHDWEKPEYKPCEGTSVSARLAYNVATQCTTDYCRVMKDAALFNFVYELNYSLKDDARRFQGQCKAWADEMGLVAEDFTER